MPRNDSHGTLVLDGTQGVPAVPAQRKARREYEPRHRPPGGDNRTMIVLTENRRTDVPRGRGWPRPLPFTLGTGPPLRARLPARRRCAADGQLSRRAEAQRVAALPARCPGRLPRQDAPTVATNPHLLRTHRRGQLEAVHVRAEPHRVVPVTRPMSAYPILGHCRSFHSRSQTGGMPSDSAAASRPARLRRSPAISP